MNKDKHLKKAADFAGPNKAYVHCEVNDPKTELAIGGDTSAIIYAAYRIIEHVCIFTGMPFDVAIGTIEDLENEKNNGG